MLERLYSQVCNSRIPLLQFCPIWKLIAILTGVTRSKCNHRTPTRPFNRSTGLGDYVLYHPDKHRLSASSLLECDASLICITPPRLVS